MVVNGVYLLQRAPIVDMAEGKMVGKGGTSFGLGEAGYDIRIKQTIRFRNGCAEVFLGDDMTKRTHWEQDPFALASAIEEFQMPGDLTGIVHDKSTWARRGLSVFNTVIEPGWKGFLTLELSYKRPSVELIIPAGSGIAQVMFHEVQQPMFYNGKYQGQEDRPVAARDSI